MPKYSLAVLATHPVHYHIPLYRAIHKSGMIDLTVYYCSDHGVKESFEREFHKSVKQDIPLLDGYNHRFLTNISPKPYQSSFFGLINIGIMTELSRKRYDAVLIHGYNNVSCLYTFLSAFITKTPVLFRGESNLLTGTRNPVKMTAKNVFLKVLFDRISAFLVIGSLNKQLYLNYGVDESRLFFSPYVTDNEFFRLEQLVHGPRKREIKKQLGIREDQIVILYCGKLVERKGVENLLAAFERAAVSAHAALVFVGDGPLLVRMKESVSRKKIENVYFLGFQTQRKLPQFYAMADVFVMPSIQSETWGIVVNEAMNFRLPVIASDRVGSAVDLVHPGLNGFIYQAKDVDGLAWHLREMAFRPNLLQEMGEQSAKIIEAWNVSRALDGVICAMRYIKRTECRTHE